MNELDWFQDIQWQDRHQPSEPVEEEVVYTVYRGQFSALAAVDFKDLATADSQIRALLN